MSLTLTRGVVNTLRFTISIDGRPVAVKAGDPIRINIITPRGKVLLPHWISLKQDAAGADWNKGVLVAEVDANQVQGIDKLSSALLMVLGDFGRNVIQLRIADELELEMSQLFVRDLAVAEMRRDQLLVASSGAMREVELTDDYIWNKLRAAESEIAHTLRILLTPHRIFPQQPTEEEIAALDGMPWMVEVPYDYAPNMFDRDRWGYFITRQRPILNVERMRFIMPSAGGQYFDIPQDWIRLDEKYGHVRILPTTNASLVTASVLGFTALTWQSIIPNMIHLTYTAGLRDAWEDYPELIDAIKKMAVVKILTDLFLPQSGSISADGLSESMSTDIGKYQEQVDQIINGQNGNGGLMALFNGIRMVVI
ncbi:hypothetical protein ACVOZ6_004702 [Escherichia coli]